MQVQVLYFASLRETLRVGEEEIALPPGSTVADLLEELRRRGSEWEIACDPQGKVRMAVNQEFAELSTQLEEGSEVALFPPVTGG